MRPSFCTQGGQFKVARIFPLAPSKRSRDSADRPGGCPGGPGYAEAGGLRVTVK
jgi:hypothetical protein